MTLVSLCMANNVCYIFGCFQVGTAVHLYLIIPWKAIHANDAQVLVQLGCSNHQQRMKEKEETLRRRDVFLSVHIYLNEKEKKVQR